jgi:hypothetical protein
LTWQRHLEESKDGYRLARVADALRSRFPEREADLYRLAAEAGAADVAAALLVLMAGRDDADHALEAAAGGGEGGVEPRQCGGAVGGEAAREGGAPLRGRRPGRAQARPTAAESAEVGRAGPRSLLTRRRRGE